MGVSFPPTSGVKKGTVEAIPENPSFGDVYIASDGPFHVCRVTGTWVPLDIKELLIDTEHEGVLTTLEVSELVDNDGTDIFLSEDTGRGASPWCDDKTKAKAVEINHLAPGETALKIFYRLKSTGSYGVKSNIYRNGVEVGTLRSTSSTTQQPYTEIIDGWSNGDTLELWTCRENSGGDPVVDQLRILGTVNVHKVDLKFDEVFP